MREQKTLYTRKQTYIFMSKKVIQNNVFSMKISDLIKERLEKLAEKEGISTASYLRNLINIEYLNKIGD